MKIILLIVSLVAFAAKSFAAAKADTRPNSASNNSAPSKGAAITLKNGVDCSSNSPCSVIYATGLELSKALNDGSLTETSSRKIIQASILPHLDFEIITKLALGNNWKQASEGQQEQIVNLFKQMLINSYSYALSKLSGAKVGINSSKISGDKQNKAAVLTTITLPNNGNSDNQPVNLEYNLARINGDWKIYDVKIENASIVTTYRSQFNEIVQKDGIGGLIKALQNKVNKPSTQQSKQKTK